MTKRAIYNFVFNRKQPPFTHRKGNLQPVKSYFPIMIQQQNQLTWL